MWRSSATSCENVTVFVVLHTLLQSERGAISRHIRHHQSYLLVMPGTGDRMIQVAHLRYDEEHEKVEIRVKSGIW